MKTEMPCHAPYSAVALPLPSASLGSAQLIMPSAPCRGLSELRVFATCAHAETTKNP